jgi:hypothetical protein
MKKVTIFSWGYWGRGSSAAQFVKVADAVEASRGYKPLLFVDVRLQRSVRAANFRECIQRIGRRATISLDE